MKLAYCVMSRAVRLLCVDKKEQFASTRLMTGLIAIKDMGDIFNTFEKLKQSDACKIKLTNSLLRGSLEESLLPLIFGKIFLN